MPAFERSIGILGGTFDPPHIGHEYLVRELLDRFQFKELLIMPTGQSYLNKSTETPGSVRLELAHAAFSGLDPRITVSDIDVTLAQKTQSRTTAWDTHSHLKARHMPLVQCIGSDQWNQISSWHRFPEVLSLYSWVVFERKGHPLARRETYGLKLDQDLVFYSTQAPEISSRLIRQDIEKTGKIPENLTSQRVKDCLMKHHLYGT